MGKIAEHKKIYTNENGVELEIKMKAECSTDGEMREALSFMAKSSHNFYLEMAKEISNELVCEKKAKNIFACPHEEILKKAEDAPSTLKIYEHYGAAKDYEAVKQGNYKSVDFLIGREEDIKELTADMSGFGTDSSQRIIIDYDKGYGWFTAKRILMDYGTFDNATLKK